MFRLLKGTAGRRHSAITPNGLQMAAERAAFHLTAGSTLDKSFAETLQTVVINDNN